MALRNDCEQSDAFVSKSPAKLKSRSSFDDITPRSRLDPMLTTEDSGEDDYLGEDDFEPFEDSVGSKSMENKLRQSPIIVPGEGDDDDDLDNALLDELGGEDESNTEKKETKEEGDPVEGMTLQEYMEEYTKKTAAMMLDDDLVNGDTVDASPEAVDPQGLDGCSPGPGQRHINGTDSPFRLEVDCFSPRSDPMRSSNIIDSPSSQHALATILAKVEDVQSQLHDMSAGNITSQQSSALPISGSPILHLHDGSAHALPYASTPVHAKHVGGEPSPDVKIDLLKRELKKKTDDLRKAHNSVEHMREEMMSLRDRVVSLEESLQDEREKHSKAVKAKNKAMKTSEKLKQEIASYDELVGGVDQMRQNEEALLKKINQLTLQNRDLSMQLKSSMARELEWRAMYRNEHQSENTATSMAIKDGVLSSHRSLPDHERSGVSRVSYERESVTERRVKKKKIASSSVVKKNSLPRLPRR